MWIPENFVDYLPSLVGGAMKMNSCFLSHSSSDGSFVEHLYRDLQEARVRCFYAPKDLKIGAITRDSIETEIHVHDKLLLVLSKNSIDSQWVEHEVEAALEVERKEKRLVLFPIMIDDAAFKSKKGWVSNLRRQRNIGNFSKWKDSARYHEAFSKLLADLAGNGG